MESETLHRIQPARLKPGVTVESLADAPGGDPTTGDAREIRGKALIFWDPERPGEKLDAIDTDQITPAKDCVSESLDSLDEKWKEGSFRHLMPDFRKRVHGGETFLIAGQRFAIGSSREMSPAGLKAVAEEVGLELVVVCGENMGDIFRRNSFNLGLEVVQCPEAVEDARDGDAFHYDSGSRKLTNETQAKSYTPPSAHREGRRDPTHRRDLRHRAREFKKSVATVPEIVWPDAETAAGLTTTEQIIWAHRVDKDAEVRPGATLRVYADLLPASDGTAPFSIHTLNQITGGDTIYPRQAAVANDHFVFTASRRTTTRPGSAAPSPRRTEWSSRTTPTPATGSSTSTSPSRGW